MSRSALQRPILLSIVSATPPRGVVSVLIARPWGTLQTLLPLAAQSANYFTGVRIATKSVDVTAAVDATNLPGRVFASATLQGDFTPESSVRGVRMATLA